MQLVKLTKKSKNKIEHIKLIIDFICLTSELKLSDTQKIVLTYFTSYGINENTKRLIFKSGLLSSNNSYKNILSKFKKLGLISKDEISRQYNVVNPILQKVDPVMGFLIKIENV